MTTEFPSELQFVDYNQIPVLEIQHPKCTAKIALQGAHLLSWQPHHAHQDVFWLSDVEPFTQGNAIRGGVPICYPWFVLAKQPAHGTARIRLWDLVGYEMNENGVQLCFQLDDEAQIEMHLGEECLLTFTHLGEEPAQVALHSYFNVANIEQVELENLPEQCFDSLTQQQQAVEIPRKITKNVDEIYPAEKSPTLIQDKGNQRQIAVEHQNGSEIVVWNPWRKATSAMSETGYQTMVCVETARIHRLLQQSEQVAVKISIKSC